MSPLPYLPVVMALLSGSLRVITISLGPELGLTSLFGFFESPSRSLPWPGGDAVSKCLLHGPWAMGQKNLPRKSSISNPQFMSLSLGFTLTGAPSPGMGLSRNQHLLTEVCPRSRGGRFRGSCSDRWVLSLCPFLRIPP